ncbi:hypothetical protein Tco_0332549 [Tanacetum coccineum]
MDFLAAHVYNLGLSLPNKFADKMDSSVPRMMANPFEERMPKLLSDTLKNILPPLYKEFNDLNKLESQRKGHSQTFDDDILKQVMLYMEEGGSAPCIPNLHHLTAAGGRPMTLEEAKLQMQETKRLADLQVKREKAEKKNRIILTSKKLTTQEEELAEIEAKHVLHMNKMRDEYNLCSKFRDDALPITNFIYRINKSSKLATMRITRNNQPLNLKVFDRFVLKMLGFTEWLELHSMASKRKSTSNDQLLKNIRAKFQWVESTADKLMIPPPPQLTALNFL